jgi:acyl-CoA synthetase (AMP-forming)/AMP-acid ligase II
VTTLFVVPTMLNMLTEAAERVGFSGPSLRTVMYGASAIAPDRLARAIALFGNIFVQCYGQSEFQLISTLPRSAHLLSEGPPPRRLASAGRPNPFVEVRIVAPDGEVLPPETPGEISVRSDTVMQGYLGRPEATAEVLSDDGWLLTGDVGLLGDDGYLYIVDRRRDMIVSGGYNIYPSEVENAIQSLAAVREVAVVGVPDDKWGEAVVAVVVAVKDSRLDAEAVKQACRDRLARYKVPKQVLFEDQLPKSPVGKILRRELKERFWRDQARRVG